MQTTSEQLEELQFRINQYEISDDEYANWRELRVTKRFLLETQHVMMAVQDEEYYEGPGRDVGSVALQATYVKAMKNTFDLVLSWEPRGFMNEE